MSKPIGYLKAMFKKKILIAGLILVLVIGYFVMPKGAKKEVIQFTTVKKQTIKSTVAASGVLSGKDSANLRFKSSGKLNYLPVKEGDQVVKGQLLAGLNTEEFSIALQQARNSWLAKDATAKNIEDQVKNHDKDENFVQRDARIAAQVARDNAYDNIRAAERNLQDAIITAPLSGIVTKISGVPGQNISVADTIIQVVDTSEIYFDAEVDESDVLKVSEGQAAEVTMNATAGKSFTGKVLKIDSNAKTTSNGATVVVVRIKFENPQFRFTSGLNGQVTITTDQVNNALSIPTEALKEDNSVLVKNQTGYKTIKVKTGLRSDTDIEIVQGLKENQQIVKNPSAIKNPANQ